MDRESKQTTREELCVCFFSVLHTPSPSSVALFCDVFLVSTFAEISWLLFCYMFGVDMLDEDSCIGHLSGWLAMQVEYLATTDGKRIESCKDV
jgi:hypothetical protein